MKSRYGTAAHFLATFTPGLELLAARFPERAYLGVAPSLLTVVAGYGEETAIVFLCFLLEDVNNFAGVKTKISVRRQTELAGIFLAEYPALKVSEYLLFFHRLKCGRYGRFYGMVDALSITSALLQFTDERRQEIARYKEARLKAAEEQQAKSASTGITFDEYLALKKRKESNHD